jgi:SAM-dependent methyltransferase
VPPARPEPVAAEPGAAGPSPEAKAPNPTATYEDLRYRDVFWAVRAYEDACDRTALRALLPPRGGRLIEVGAGFGRLASEYAGYDEVVLLDSSPTHVAAALETLAGRVGYEVRLGDALALPYADGYFDAAVCVRVLHHFGDPAPVIAELGRVVRPGGVLVVEYANKRNLKSMARRLLRHQTWSPFEPDSVAYKPFHFDHSPVAVRRALRASGCRVERVRAVSLFRVPGLSRHVSPGLLARLEAPLQEPLGGITPGPSVFVLARRLATPEPSAPRSADAWLGRS